MTFKTTLLSATAIAASIFAVNALANGLTITDTHFPSSAAGTQIAVSCNGQPGVNIPVPGTTGALPWLGIEIKDGNKSTADCQFSYGGHVIGSAHLVISGINPAKPMNSGTGTISNIDNKFPTLYSVTATASNTSFATTNPLTGNNISVTIKYIGNQQ